MRTISRFAALALATAVTAVPVQAHSGGHHTASLSQSSPSSHSGHAYVHASSKPYTSATHHHHHESYLGEHDSNGHHKRSTAAKHAFKHQHPCPSTGKTTGSCPGYVIDHVIPLKRGGPDDPSNMQWQTEADAKAKDKWE